MDGILPSYEDATARDPLVLISPYLRKQDLLSAVIVSRAWYNGIIHRLWNNPTDIMWAKTEANPFAHFRAFLQTLEMARLNTRALTCCLEFSTWGSNFCEDLEPSWLWNVLTRLPNLQALIVPGLPDMDHRAISLVVDRGRAARKDGRRVVMDFRALRLMNAAHCENISSKDASDFCKCFENLTYLDLSYTKLSDVQVIRSLGTLSSLQILKLRNIGLQDRNLAVLAKYFGYRLRSLDIRDNNLTEQSVDVLMSEMIPESASESDSILHNNLAGLVGLSDTAGAIISSHFYSVDQDDYVYRVCSEARLDGPIGIEPFRYTGLTNLYIAGNKLTFDATLRLIRSSGLLVLDAVPSRSEPGDEVEVGRSGGYGDGDSSQLRYLRVHHSLVSTPLRVAQINMTEYDAPPSYYSLDSPEFDSSTSDRAYSRTTLLEYEAYRESVAQLKRLSLRPSSFSDLEILVLAGIPEKTTDPHISHSIIDFITLCAAEAYWARRRAQVDYTLPPDERRRTAMIAARAKSLFGLRRIVLELIETRLDVVASPKQPIGQKSSHSTQRIRYPQLSSVEDPDCEVLWSAAEDDFSFFENERIGTVSSRETKAVNPNRNQSEGGAAVSTGRTPVTESSGPSAQSIIDVVAEIGKFRQEKRRLYGELVAEGELDPYIEGYWSGEVTVIRPATRSQ